MSQNNSDLKHAQILDQSFQLFKSKGLKDFEIYSARSNQLKIDSKDQKVDSLTQAEDIGISIRVFKDKKTGFSFTTNPSVESISKAIDSASQICDLMPEDSDFEFRPFSSNIPKITNRLDLEGLRVPTQAKIQKALELERFCKSKDQRIQGVRSASFSQTEFSVSLVNSFGEKLHHEGTLFSASISCKAEENGDAQMGGDYQFHPFYSRLDIDSVATKAASTATELLGSVAPQTFRKPAIIRNSVVAELIDFLSSSLNGEEIYKGKSLLKGKLGEKVFHKDLCLSDDGLLENGYSTRPFDGEGNASQKTPLIEGGIFKNALTDRLYSKKLGLPCTSNATRSIKSPPMIAQTNLVLTPGSKSFEQLLKEAHDGILIVDLMGVHTANPVTGNFSLGASGILIENGRLTTPVRGFAVAGNVIDLFKSFKYLGSDLEFFGNTGACSILLPELSISGNS